LNRAATPASVATAPTLAADPAGLFADAGLVRGGDGVLRLDEVSLEAIATDLGTPVYVYNGSSIRARYRALSESLAGIRHRIHYAVKANSNLAVLRLLREIGAGADIVSAGELNRVLATGFDPSTVVFSGVGKSEAELTAAVDAGIGSINLESSEEHTLLERLVAGRVLPHPVRVGIRVNLDVGVETHPYITTGGRAIKFGVRQDAVPGLARRIAANPRFKLVTLATHLGSQLLDPRPFVAAAKGLGGLLQTLRAEGIDNIESIDIGGGFGISYDDSPAIDLQALGAGLAAVIDQRVALHLEPGRFLIGSAGILLTRVLFRKHAGAKAFVVVDAAMNDLVRPSLYHAHHEIVETVAHGRPVQVVDVVGPVCESGDFLAQDRPIAEVQQGEHLAVLGVGAYGFVMASNYNSRPRPPEVLVDRGRYGVARRRETIAELLAAERADPFS
jgi:diaminopimelate decarboxylase